MFLGCPCSIYGSCCLVFIGITLASGCSETLFGFSSVTHTLLTKLPKPLQILPAEVLRALLCHPLLLFTLDLPRTNTQAGHRGLWPSLVGFQVTCSWTDGCWGTVRSVYKALVFSLSFLLGKAACKLASHEAFNTPKVILIHRMLELLYSCLTLPVLWTVWKKWGHTFLIIGLGPHFYRAFYQLMVSSNRVRMRFLIKVFCKPFPWISNKKCPSVICTCLIPKHWVLCCLIPLFAWLATEWFSGLQEMEGDKGGKLQHMAWNSWPQLCMFPCVLCGGGLWLFPPLYSSIKQSSPLWAVQCVTG